MLIDIGCPKKYIDVFLIKFLCFLSKNSIKNYNTLFDIYFEGANELIGATQATCLGPFGVPFEILMECFSQNIHQFHQN